MFHQVECLLAVPHRAIGAIAEAIIERSVTRRRREVERCKAQAGGVAFEMAAQQAGDALPPRVRGDVDIADPRPPGPGIPIHAVARPEAGDAEGIAVFERDEAARERGSEEHTSELQSLMRSSYAVFCLKNKEHRQTNAL